MRSEQVHKILLRDNNRFGICRTASEHLRLLHRPGTRVGDSIGQVLSSMATQNIVLPVPVSPSLNT